MEEKDEKKEVKPVITENKEEKKVLGDEKKETKKEENKKEIKKDEKKVETKNKFNNSKANGKKSNNGVMIAGVVVVAIIIAIVIYMLVMIDSPKKALDKMFKEIKEGVTEEEIGELLQEEDFNEDTRKAIFENLSWKILSEKEEGETAVVEVEVTNKDFATIINNFKEKIVKAAFSGESIDEAKTQEYLLGEINNTEIENVTNTYSITVEKQDNKWVVSETNDIVNMLLPGFSEAINSLY